MSCHMTSDLSFEVNRLIIISDNNVTELFIAMFPAAIACVDNIQNDMRGF